MLTIGVELNHVVRNINKQILKYYAKEFDPSMDWEEMDDKCDVFPSEDPADAGHLIGINVYGL